MCATTHVLLSLCQNLVIFSIFINFFGQERGVNGPHLDALVVAFGAVEHLRDLLWRERRVGEAFGLDDDARVVEVFVRLDGVVASDVMGGRVRHDQVLEPAASETRGTGD